MPYKNPEMARARRRNRAHMRRVTISDITAAQELAMRERARKCPLCDVRMTSKPHLPDSKELDHILPVNRGGTHTHGNVRIICRKCNQARPKDGSDYTGMLTLWAQGESPVSRPDMRSGDARGTCRKGLHPWVPTNISTGSDGKRLCILCRRAADQRNRRHSLQLCKCGALYGAAGNTFMCLACTDAAAHKAAELHAAGGVTWNQVAIQVGYSSGEGARYAAKRIGYAPPAKEPPQPKPLRRCRCGASIPEGPRGMNHGRCDECVRALAIQSADLYATGHTLRHIADELGYRSITSVSNMIKSVSTIEMRVGGRRHAA